MKVIFLNRLSSDMKNSGHSINFRTVILKKVVARYIYTLSNHQEGVCNMYRSSQERINQKKTTSILNQKDTWFRAGGATSTLCVPPTPRSELAKLVEANLGRSRQPEGTKVKVIEGNGLSTSRGLVRANQFPREICSRPECGVSAAMLKEMD